MQQLQQGTQQGVLDMLPELPEEWEYHAHSPV
jgi:hypothetical protein